MKKLLTVLLLLSMLLSFISCGQSPQPDGSEDDNNSREELDVEYPLTVTDQKGREVLIEEEPQRIVSGYYISTSAIIALGLADKMVGIEDKADKRAIYKLAAPELISLPNVGNKTTFSAETCASLSPDLVILPAVMTNHAETLEELGIDVLLVNPESQQLLTEMVELIALATNAKPKAKELLDYTDRQQQLLEAAVIGAEAPTVYLAGKTLLRTAGNGMYQADMIAMAGGVNAAKDIDSADWADISYEQLLLWDPDYIVIASDSGCTVEDVLSDPNLADCKAVKNAKVYKLPSKAESWDSPIPGGILGAIWVASVLHPDCVSTSECDEVIETFYERFYGFKYSES